MVTVICVGCGAALELLYRQPLREMEKLGWLKVHGLVDAVEQRAQTAAGWFRQARGFRDLEVAFDTLGQTDLAIIASPPAFHASQAIAAFERNCHVLCEKPMSHSASSAEEMVEKARKHNRLLAVGMARRFYPAVEMARSWVRESNGSPLVFSYREGSLFDWPVASPAQFRRSTGAGGVLIDKGIHAVDTLYHTFGPGRLVRSADDAAGGEGVESNAALELAFCSSRGFLQVSWESPLNNGFHLASEGGELWLPLSPVDAVWRRRRAGGQTWEKVKARAAWPSNLASVKPTMVTPMNVFECVRLQLVSVLRSILLGERPVASGDEGLEVLRLVMAAYEQATPLQQPWLPVSEQRTLASTHWKALTGVRAKTLGDQPCPSINH
jgi:predicted dehydrogenase